MPADKKAMNRALAIAALALLSGLGDLRAAAVCSNSPSAGDWIECEQPSTSSTDIDIDATSIDIDTTAEDGVRAVHAGTGDIDISITGTPSSPSTIDATGASYDGIFYFHSGSSGDATVTLEHTRINANHFGIQGTQQGPGELKADLNQGVRITTSGSGGNGVSLNQAYGAGTSDVIIEADQIQITTSGQNARGLRASHVGSGEIRIDVRDSTITTQGHGAYGIDGYRANSSGDIDIDVVGGRTTTNGYLGFGIYARHDHIGGNAKTGNIEITTRNHAIETRGTAHHSSLQGTYSYGIYADHENAGNIVIELGEGSSVVTRGKNSHGIVAYQRHATMPGNIDITLDGPVTVHGAAAQGVRIGAVGSNGVPERMAPLDNDGYRRQTVTVNRPIRSTAEGVFLANGGRVIIGPQGQILSGSNIAIRATGTVPEDSTDPMNVIPAILPKLRVDLNLAGRRVATVIGNGWIINDGGETTIFVNDVKLHDGKTGATGDTVANGIWDVSLAASGVNRDLSTTPPSTTGHPRESPGRDFSAADFVEACTTPPCPTLRPTPPRSTTPSPPSGSGPEPEPEPQVHRVNEPVVVGAQAMAGVHIEGDGAVYVGAQGRFEAASGIAILATGDAPDLLVDLDLDGRRIAEVIGDDWIINDGGNTTIVVNDVKLHDGETGVVPGASAPNGARNVRAEADSVRIREEGVRVTDRSDPDLRTGSSVTRPGA